MTALTDNVSVGITESKFDEKLGLPLDYCRMELSDFLDEVSTLISNRHINCCKILSFIAFIVYAISLINS
jgi:hypothetical protein